eukprot:550810-Lingulodinium_polyedra.AAC.1
MFCARQCSKWVGHAATLIAIALAGGHACILTLRDTRWKCVAAVAARWTRMHSHSLRYTMEVCCSRCRAGQGPCDALQTVFQQGPPRTHCRMTRPA